MYDLARLENLRRKIDYFILFLFAVWSLALLWWSSCSGRIDSTEVGVNGTTDALLKHHPRLFWSPCGPDILIIPHYYWAIVSWRWIICRVFHRYCNKIKIFYLPLSQIICVQRISNKPNPAGIIQMITHLLLRYPKLITQGYCLFIISARFTRSSH